MSNMYYYSNPTGRPYRLTNTNLLGPNSSLPSGLQTNGQPDEKVNYFATKMIGLNANGSAKNECFVYYRGIKSRSEGAPGEVPTEANQRQPNSYWESLTIQDGSSTLIAEGHYPTGGNLNAAQALETATSSGVNRFHVTQADGLFTDATSVDIEYDTPGDGDAGAEWNPFREGGDSSLFNGNRRFRRMTVNGMRV